MKTLPPIKIDDELYKALRNTALINKLSISQVVRDALNSKVKKKKNTGIKELENLMIKDYKGEIKSNNYKKYLYGNR